MSDDAQRIRQILDKVVDSVHNLDYEAVRHFIPDDGLYFGSVATMARGYDELREQQFTKVWPNVSEFNIPSESIVVHVARPLAWATCLFRSGARGPGNQPAERRGRMTFIFELRDENWMMVHSHDSLYPVVAEQT